MIYSNDDVIKMLRSLPAVPVSGIIAQDFYQMVVKAEDIDALIRRLERLKKRDN